MSYLCSLLAEKDNIDDNLLNGIPAMCDQYKLWSFATRSLVKSKSMSVSFFSNAVKCQTQLLIFCENRHLSRKVRVCRPRPKLEQLDDFSFSKRTYDK